MRRKNEEDEEYYSLLPKISLSKGAPWYLVDVNGVVLAYCPTPEAALATAIAMWGDVHDVPTTKGYHLFMRGSIRGSIVKGNMSE